MKPMHGSLVVFAFVTVFAAATAAWSVGGTAQTAPSTDEIVASLKQNLAESQERLRQYEWIETTAISLKGEEKSRAQKRVHYGANGTLTRTPIGAAPAPQAAPSGRRGGRLAARVVENKKDEMQDYMERAVALIRKYVPPDAALIQKAKDAGRMQVQPVPPGTVRAAFTDFIQPSDAMSIEVDVKALLLSGLTVSTYLDEKDEAVTLDVRFGALTDGTGYAARTTLEAKAKNIRVVLENSGHRPLAR
jgi:hypothetical protein